MRMGLRVEDTSSRAPRSKLPDNRLGLVLRGGMLYSRLIREKPAIYRRRRGMAQDVIDDLLAEHPVLRRILGQIDAVELLVETVEALGAKTVGQGLPNFLLIVGKHHIDPAGSLLQHVGQEGDVIGFRIYDDREVPQRILQSYPGGGIGVHFLGQGIYLQIGQAIDAGELLQSSYAVISGGVVDNDKFVITYQGTDNSCRALEDALQLGSLITNDEHD